MAQSTVPRSRAAQSLPTHRLSGRGTRSPLASLFVLAFWQLKTSWRLLLIIGLGLLTSVVLVCAIPLYTQVTLSAGLRQTLLSDPGNLYLSVQASSQLFSNQAVASVQDQITEIVREDMSSLVSTTPDISIQVPTLTIDDNHFIRVVGTNTELARQHAKVIEGRLPASTSGNTIEFALTQDCLNQLGMHLGQTLHIRYVIDNPYDFPPQIIEYLDLKLVGVTAPIDSQDIFWHGETFEKQLFSVGLSDKVRVPIMVSNTELAAQLERVSQNAPPLNGRNLGPRLLVAPDIYWFYKFDFSNIDINHLSDVSNNLKNVLTTLSKNPIQPPYVLGTSSYGPLTIFTSYSDRLTVLELPINCLAYLIAAMALFFALVIMDILVDSQSEAVSVLRSRGATARQIFGALLGQTLLLSLLIFLIGPLLAILATIAIAHLTLSTGEQDILRLITAHPLLTAQGEMQRDAVVIGVALLAMLLALWRVQRSNILGARWESARSTRQPFWMRLKLDLLAATIALVGFAFSLYIQHSNVLDLHTRTLILPLTTVVGVLFLLLGLLLLFLRSFPTMLRAGENLAARNRGAAPLLALTQLARSPRQGLRITLLFALAIAFALFTLVFNQSQGQRLKDITAYQAGGDFSGTLPDVVANVDWQHIQELYSSMKGVTSATVGTDISMVGGSNQDVSLDLMAVNASTYASTMYWSSQYSDQSASELTTKLLQGKAAAEKQHTIPAIIDDLTAQSMSLTIGQTFSLADFHGPMNYIVVGRVHSLPTVYDAPASATTDSSIAQGGVLVDYQTYSDVAQAVHQYSITPSEVWLRLSTQAVQMHNARNALLKGTYALQGPLDRMAMLQDLQNDPIFGTIVGILFLGAIVSLCLGLLGNFLVSWWNARSRLASFAVLRALGSGSTQITRILIWEQGIVYGTAFLLGGILGIVFSLVILPVFIFSPGGESTPDAFYLLQSQPPVQVLFPLGQILLLVGVLLIICLLALSMMLRIVTARQVGQTLRLNED